MKAKFQLIDPEAMEASITITMTLKQWREVMRQQPQQWPACEVGRLIASVIGEANQTFTAEIRETT